MKRDAILNEIKDLFAVSVTVLCGKLDWLHASFSVHDFCMIATHRTAVTVTVAA